jgi:formylglycine-generating enzyme
MRDPWRLHWRDYYEILQVIPTAEREVVEGAYKRLAAKYHPDKGLGDVGKMKLLNEAYDVLYDPETRTLYDVDCRRKQCRHVGASKEAGEVSTCEREAKAQAEGVCRPDEAACQQAEAAHSVEEDGRRSAEEAHQREREAFHQDQVTDAATWTDHLETVIVASVVMGLVLMILSPCFVSWGAFSRPKSASAVEDGTPKSAVLVAEIEATKVDQPARPYLLESAVPTAGTPPAPSRQVKVGADYPMPILSDTGIEMVCVGQGSFRMGSTTGSGDEKPVHTVRITRPFWMSKYEVTQSQYEAVTATNPSFFWGAPNLPVEGVSWEDAVDFCQKLTDRERQAGRLPVGYVYRLPTEAEWEYAARGGGKGRGFEYAGSNMPDDVAWYESNSDRKTHPVGQKRPNELDIYDMSGNVWEWCQDWYGDDYYSRSPSSDSTGPSSGSGRVVRGGSWCGSRTGCRLLGRDGLAPELTYYGCGFRVVVSFPLD